MKTMQSLCCAIAAALTISFTTTPADAQTRPAPRRAQSDRVPDTGVMAIGLSAGLAIPTSDDLKTGFGVGLNLERYFTPRVSVRGQLGAAWMDLQGHSFEGTEKPVSFTGNLVYNWEGGKIHPYATGGLGYYHFRYTESDVDSSDNHFGGNLGGGIEYFFSRRDTITAEALVHLISGRAEGALSSHDATYWTILFGYKKYWR